MAETARARPAFAPDLFSISPCARAKDRSASRTCRSTSSVCSINVRSSRWRRVSSSANLLRSSSPSPICKSSPTNCKSSRVRRASAKDSSSSASRSSVIVTWLSARSDSREAATRASSALVTASVAFPKARLRSWVARSPPEMASLAAFSSAVADSISASAFTRASSA